MEGGNCRRTIKLAKEKEKERGREKVRKMKKEWRASEQEVI